MKKLVWIVLVAGCVVKTGEETTPPPGGGAPAGGGQTIEAGCSDNGTQLTGDVGAEFQVSCPANCEAQGGLWGSDVYTLDSAVCRAGIHAGAITSAGGVVVVRIEPGRPAYRGSARNGIASGDYGQYGKSFAVVNAQAAPPATAGGGSQVIEAGCSYNATQIVGDVGTRVVVACPANCPTSGIWGTDVYTLDSNVCQAAVHTGLIQVAAGGQVAVIIEAGRPAYRGSERNGVKTGDYGQYNKSYHLERP